MPHQEKHQELTRIGFFPDMSRMRPMHRARAFLAFRLIVAALGLCATAQIQAQTLLHRWSFNNNSDPGLDSIAAIGYSMGGEAYTSNGKLILDGSYDAYFLSSAFGSPLGAKSLVVWVSLSTLNQSGGSALTIGNFGGADVFDGIVFGEQQPRVWMAGSDGFSRTESGGPEESVQNAMVMVAITYSLDGTISVYRNGVSYYTYSSWLNGYTGDVQALIGYRHEDLIGNGGPLAGEIDEARVYSGALDETAIAAIYLAGANALPGSAVPEPASYALIFGLVGFAVLRSRRKNHLTTD